MNDDQRLHERQAEPPKPAWGPKFLAGMIIAAIWIGLAYSPLGDEKTFGVSTMLTDTRSMTNALLSFFGLNHSLIKQLCDAKQAEGQSDEELQAGSQKPVDDTGGEGLGSDKERIAVMVAGYKKSDWYNPVSLSDKQAKEFAKAALKVDHDNAEDVFYRAASAVASCGGLSTDMEKLSETGQMNQDAEDDLIYISKKCGVQYGRCVYNVLMAFAPRPSPTSAEQSSLPVSGANSSGIPTPTEETSSPRPPPRKGSTIVITATANLYFRDQFYRVAKPGEEFQVYEYRPNEKKLYILSKDSNGNPIGLNIPDQ